MFPNPTYLLILQILIQTNLLAPNFAIDQEERLAVLDISGVDGYSFLLAIEDYFGNRIREWPGTLNSTGGPPRGDWPGKCKARRQRSRDHHG